MTAREINFDGLVGPSHHYGGLAWGNVASHKSRGQIANPKAAALQGLDKMNFCYEQGLTQGVLPPQERPFFPVLKKLGFGSEPKEALEKAYQTNPGLLSACSSASAMWTANIGTTSPSADSLDGKVHFTPANLSIQIHRSLEAEFSQTLLKKVFPSPKHFSIHDPLPPVDFTSDEGAANHLRLSDSHGEKGLQIFVYGREGLSPIYPTTHSFPIRQSREASTAVARLHQLDSNQVIFQAQNSESIQKGIFHNDVISVATENIFLFHEYAFENQPQFLNQLQKKWDALYKNDLHLLEITQDQVPLEEVVASYLFNSQLITLPGGNVIILAPEESRLNKNAFTYLEEQVAGPGPIHAVHYLDLKQSMSNGGGPACLRFKVVLTDEELSHVHPGVLWSPTLYAELKNWVKKHYRDALKVEDLGDFQFYTETQTALQELTEILKLGDIYPFQKG